MSPSESKTAPESRADCALPGADNRWLPDVEEVVSPLAYACARE